VQRNYVTLLGTLARPRESEAEAAHHPKGPSPDRLPTIGANQGSPAILSSDLSEAARGARDAQGRPSEFRAAVRAAAKELAARITAAEGKVRDRTTAAHLADLLAELRTLQ
jgi:hypothetical protein